jgi:hypothetical protein
MKLAEALALRSDLQKRVASLVERAQVNARFQEGESPAENASALVAEADTLLDELEKLIAGINRTNSVTQIGDSGVTATQALAHRDILRARHSMYTKVADAAAGQMSTRGVPFGRQLRSELKLVSAVDVEELRAKADQSAIELRELDAQIQETNWSVDLLD